MPHPALAELMEQRFDHAQRLVVGVAAVPDLIDAQLLEELVHCQQHLAHVDVLPRKETVKVEVRISKRIGRGLLGLEHSHTGTDTVSRHLQKPLLISDLAHQTNDKVANPFRTVD